MQCRIQAEKQTHGVQHSWLRQTPAPKTEVCPPRFSRPSPEHSQPSEANDVGNSVHAHLLLQPGGSSPTDFTTSRPMSRSRYLPAGNIPPRGLRAHLGRSARVGVQRRQGDCLHSQCQSPSHGLANPLSPASQGYWRAEESLGADPLPGALRRHTSGPSASISGRRSRGQGW